VRLILLKVPPPLSEELERRLPSPEGPGLRFQVERVARLEALPPLLPAGLVVLADSEGTLEETAELCRQLHARRGPARTHLLVLTRRAPAEVEALARAGADEFLEPPGEHWGARLISLQRRLLLDKEPPERLQPWTAVERTRDLLVNALNAMPDPIFIKDREHRWIAVNHAFCRLLGRTPDELLGKSDYDFVPKLDADLYWQQDELVFSTGKSLENEQTYSTQAGTTRFLVTKKACFTGTGGEPFLVVVIQDITERKRLETQLRLADRMASVGTLANGFAHEINNPIAYVSSNLSFLAEELSRDAVLPTQLAEMREAIAESQQGVGRVRDIIQALQTFAQGATEERRPVDVHHAIESALMLMSKDLQRRARLERELAPVPSVLGSEAQLGQVLINLLKNALLALAQRPIERNTIRVATRSTAGWVHIEVEDNGQGMSPEVQQRIFDPFFTTWPESGTGLGLSISHSLIRLMGGWIETQSTQGQGSTFRLVLPAFTAP
jgi:two-component system NtrC family sensor kinase